MFYYPTPQNSKIFNHGAGFHYFSPTITTSIRHLTPSFILFFGLPVTVVDMGFSFFLLFSMFTES